MKATHAVWLLAGLAAAPLAADEARAERRNFVACPIVRDTASVPCWLAEHDGELYFLTLQTDVSSPVTPPWLGHRVLRIPLGVMVGTMSGIQTQPAVLAFAVEKTGRDLPNVGYATVFPLAMMTKIVLAQLVFRLLP